MDAVKSFSYLVDNIPSWKDRVTQLSGYTTQKHQEFRAEYTRLVEKAKPRRLKSPSICSIRTDDDLQHDDGQVERESTPQPPDPVDINPFEAGNRYIYAQATKKRKPGTSFRSGASGPLKFRSKQMVVIYYDSYVQDQLDSLVKSIGGSRNNLRKGKNAYTISKGMQLPSLSRKHDITSPISQLGGNKSSPILPNATKDLKDENTPPVESAPSGDAAFKMADKDLETCQNLCETAAHQFLRDGDCKLELDTVIVNLDKIMGFAKSSLETFKAEEKEETHTEDMSVNGSTHTESDATLVEKPSREVLKYSHKLMPSPNAALDPRRPSLPTSNSAPPMMTEIEVDDESDQSEIEIDISQFRMAGRAANRGRVRA